MSFERFLIHTGVVTEFQDGAADAWGKPSATPVVVATVPCRLVERAVRPVTNNPELVIETSRIFLRPIAGVTMSSKHQVSIGARKFDIAAAKMRNGKLGPHHLSLDVNEVEA